MSPSSLLLVTWLVGCTGDGPPVDSAVPPTCSVGVEAGTGVVDFLPLADGGTLSIVHGPQGGYHLDAAAKLCGLPSEPTSLHVVVTWIEHDLVVADVTYEKPEVPLDDCCRTATGITAYLFIDDQDARDALDGQDVRYRLEVTDADDVLHVDEIRLTLTR